jgi:magnesium-transporting ATPase (P-type)
VYGKNEIEHAKAKTYLELCWEAAQDSTLIMLQIAATVSLVLETSTADEDHIDTAWIEGVAIFVTVFIVINVTAFNDYRKEQQFRALKAKVCHAPSPAPCYYYSIRLKYSFAWMCTEQVPAAHHTCVCVRVACSGG